MPPLILQVSEVAEFTFESYLLSLSSLRTSNSTKRLPASKKSLANCALSLLVLEKLNLRRWSLGLGVKKPLFSLMKSSLQLS